MAEQDVQAAVGETIRQHFEDLLNAIKNLNGGVNLGPITTALDQINTKLDQILANQAAHTTAIQQVLDQIGESAAPSTGTNQAFVPPPQP